MAAMLQSRIEVARGEYVPDADHRVVMAGLDWNRFEQLLAIRGNRSQPRMAYLDGAIELMTTSRSREHIERRIAILLETYMLDTGIPFEPAGSWTVKEQAEEAGAEPGECYFVPLDPTRPVTDRTGIVV
jgi:hypothetical protein